MLTAIIPAITSLISSAIDKAVPDKNLAEELKAKITLEAMKADNEELKSATSIIMAEANGESFIQRAWRPLLMINFSLLVTAHWLGFTPENLSQETINHLLDIVQVGVGGYIAGRSGEKMLKTWKEK